jgi:creatinine amidohydrolase
MALQRHHMRPVYLTAFMGLICLASPLSAQAPSVPQPDTVFLEELTWMEVRDAIAGGKTTIIIPTGGTEQNGPHLALGKHNFLVKYKAGEVAKRLGNALVAPVVAYVPEGDIDPPTSHMRFAGTITTPQEVFAKVLEYAARSFKQHGFLDIALIGDSGGNQAGQQLVAEAMNKEWAATNVRVHHVSAYYPRRGRRLGCQPGRQRRRRRLTCGDARHLEHDVPESFNVAIRQDGTGKDRRRAGSHR